MSTGESTCPAVSVKMGATILDPFLEAIRSSGVSGVIGSEAYEPAPARFNLRRDPLG